MAICKWHYFIYLVESIYVGAICPSGNGDVHTSKDTVLGVQLALRWVTIDGYIDIYYMLLVHETQSNPRSKA